MAIDKKELAKLSAEERLKKLKLMGEDRKKEVDEIEILIKESMQELKINRIAGEVAPEQKVVDISRLFESTNEQILERTAKQETPPAAFINSTKGYQIVMQAYQDYVKLKTFYGVVSMGGDLTEQQMTTVGKIGERILIVERYIPIGEETANILDASRAVLRKLKKETGFG